MHAAGGSSMPKAAMRAATPAWERTSRAVGLRRESLESSDSTRLRSSQE